MRPLTLQCATKVGPLVAPAGRSLSPSMASVLRLTPAGAAAANAAQLALWALAAKELAHKDNAVKKGLNFIQQQIVLAALPAPRSKFCETPRPVF